MTLEEATKLLAEARRGFQDVIIAGVCQYGTPTDVTPVMPKGMYRLDLTALGISMLVQHMPDGPKEESYGTVDLQMITYDPVAKDLMFFLVPQSAGIAETVADTEDSLNADDLHDLAEAINGLGTSGPRYTNPPMQPTDNQQTVALHAPVVKFKKTHPDAKLPEYKTAGAVGFDISILNDIELAPRVPQMVPTGLRIKVNEGYECQIRMRSGTAAKGIILTNSPGTVDPDYNGELKLLLCNITDMPIPLAAGTRVCQGVVSPVTRASVELVDDLDETERGSGGFGSTGDR